MTCLTEHQAAKLAEQLADLPRLAADTIIGSRGGAKGPNQAPPGVDLAKVDAGREQPHLLARITGCIQVAFEECPSLRQHPLAAKPTWTSETRWLIDTMGRWQGDDWCAEWITGEVRTVREALLGLIERAAGYRVCGECGGPVEAYQAGAGVAIAECRDCRRILGMAETEPPKMNYRAAQRLLAAILDKHPKSA